MPSKKTNATTGILEWLDSELSRLLVLAFKPADCSWLSMIISMPS
jgi:hypothetical protein